MIYFGAKRLRVLTAAIVLTVFASASAQDSGGPRVPNSELGHREATLGGTPEKPLLRVEVWLDRERLTVADRLTLWLRISTLPGVQYAWTPPTGIFGDFQVAQQSEDSEDVVAGVVVKVLRFVLEPRNADGAKVVPPLEFRITAPKGPEAGMKMRTPSLAVQVDSVLDEAARASPEFSGPKGPRSLDEQGSRSRSRTMGLAVGAGSAIGMGAAWVAWFYLRRRSTEPQSPREAARASLGEIRVSLQELRNRPLEATDFDLCGEEVRRLGSAIGGTTRAYLEDHLGIRARAAAVHEMRCRLQDAPALSREMADRIMKMLERLEAGTFAPERPSAGGMLDELEVAEAMLAETSSYIPPANRAGGAE